MVSSFRTLNTYDSIQPKRFTEKWPLLALVLAAIVALIVVIWQLQTSPETNDAYYADTIDVVPEVSGRIVEMPIRDNQRVKKGDLLFRIDPRPYQAMLDDAKSRLAALDAQIMLTQRTIKAQQYNAQSVSAAVERAKALVKQTTSTRIRRNRWCRRDSPRRKISIRRVPRKSRPRRTGSYAAAG